MENKPAFIFGLTEQTDTMNPIEDTPHEIDIKNLEKVVLQSFKYCQAKKSKNNYIRSKKIDEIKSYQKKLISIIRKKSEETISSLMAFSNQMVLSEESLCIESSKSDEQTLSRLKHKLTSLKENNPDHTTPHIMKQKLKRVTIECEEELQRMESSQKIKKTDTQFSHLINKMEKPFKKMCGYFSLLNKELAEMKEASQLLELKKTDSQQTE